MSIKPHPTPISHTDVGKAAVKNDRGAESQAGRFYQEKQGGIMRGEGDGFWELGINRVWRVRKPILDKIQESTEK